MLHLDYLSCRSPLQIEVAIANGKITMIAFQEGGITEQTYYRCRKEFGGLQVDQARRLKELEQENVKPKQLVSEPGWYDRTPHPTSGSVRRGRSSFSCKNKGSVYDEQEVCRETIRVF